MNYVTKLSGVTFEDRQEIIKNLDIFSNVQLMRDYNNIYDRNAIAVIDEKNRKIGWIPKETAAKLAPLIDNGKFINTKVLKKIGGGGYIYGLLVEITLLMSDKEKHHKSYIGTTLQFIENRLTTAEEEAINEMVSTCYNNLITGTNPNIQHISNLNVSISGEIHNNTMRFILNKELSNLNYQFLYSCEFNFNNGFVNNYSKTLHDNNLEIVKYTDNYFYRLFINLLEYIEEQLRDSKFS